MIIVVLLAAITVIGIAVLVDIVHRRLLLVQLVLAGLVAIAAGGIATRTSIAAAVGHRRTDVAKLWAGTAGQIRQSVPRRRRLLVRIARPTGGLLGPCHCGWVRWVSKIRIAGYASVVLPNSNKNPNQCRLFLTSSLPLFITESLGMIVSVNWSATSAERASSCRF